MPQTSDQQNGKKMTYKKVSFDVNEIAPDAPEGEWKASIPRGKCKVQPTKEDRYPMIIIPVRLDKTDEEGANYAKALGTELSAMVVFFDDEKAKAARMSKLRLRQICEALDIDLDLIPKEITDPDNDLEPLIRALEGQKNFTVWTKHQTRRDTGEVVTELLFNNPKGVLKSASDDDDDDSNSDRDEDEDEKPSKPVKKAPAKKKAANNKKS